MEWPAIPPHPLSPPGKNGIVQMDKIPLETQGEDSAIRFRDCFSVRYIQAAAVLCRLGFAIEQEYREDPDIPADLRLRHEAFILNSVLSTVAFLESAVNELHADAADDAYFFADEQHEALLRVIAEKWHNERNFDRAPMITKYQKILEIAPGTLKQFLFRRLAAFLVPVRPVAGNGFVRVGHGQYPGNERDLVLLEPVADSRVEANGSGID